MPKEMKKRKVLCLTGADALKKPDLSPIERFANAHEFVFHHESHDPVQMRRAIDALEGVSGLESKKVSGSHFEYTFTHNGLQKTVKLIKESPEKLVEGVDIIYKNHYDPLPEGLEGKARVVNGGIDLNKLRESPVKAAPDEELSDFAKKLLGDKDGRKRADELIKKAMEEVGDQELKTDDYGQLKKKNKKRRG